MSCSAAEDKAVGRLACRRELLEQAALPDTWLAGQQGDRRAACARLGECLTKRSKFTLPTDKWRPPKAQDGVSGSLVGPGQRLPGHLAPIIVELAACPASPVGGVHGSGRAPREDLGEGLALEGAEEGVA